MAGANAIGRAAQQVAGEAAVPVLGLEDPSSVGSDLGQVERRAAVAHGDVDAELVEARFDLQRSAGIGAFDDRLDRLRRR